jgi:hypothetical protein
VRQLFNGLFAVPVKVMGQEQWFLLDTGASGVSALVVDEGEGLAAVKDAASLEYPEALRMVDGSKTTFRAAHGTLCVGALCWDHAPLALVRRESAGPTLRQFKGVLGAGFLRHFRVSVDFPQRILYLEQEVPFETSAWTFGLVVQPVKGELAVQTVARGGPAERAGIQPGDVVRSLDGLGAARRADVLFKLLDAPQNGKAVDVAMDRNGRSTEIHLVPEET